MKTIFLWIALILPVSSFAQETTPVEIKSVNCKVRNVVGIPIGNATITGEQIELALGFSKNYLTRTSSTASSVLGVNKAGSWEYTFQFENETKPGSSLFKTTIYQRRLLNHSEEVYIFAKAVCSVAR